MISFEPTEDQKLMVESVAGFARGTLRPRIRQFEKERQLYTPIIALTAHAMKGDRERCLDAGMDKVIHKPIDAARFVDEVEALALATR